MRLPLALIQREPQILADVIEPERVYVRKVRIIHCYDWAVDLPYDWAVDGI